MKRSVLDRPTAWGYLVTNLAVLPGLGSIMAGKRVGYAQATVALSGFILSLVFAAIVVRHWWLVRALPELTARLVILGAGGVGLFLSGWFWSLITGLALLREARPKENQPASEGQPPLIR